MGCSVSTEKGMEAKEKRNSGKLRHFSVFIGIIIFAVWADQFTKRLALTHLALHEPHPLIPGVLELLRIENTGAAFGILEGHMGFFYVITAVVGALILYVVCRFPAEKKYDPLLLVASFIAAGAIGNLIDRVMRKSVVDFIYFVPIDFPVFNVADIFVSCATAALMLLILFYYKDDDLDFLKNKRS